MGKGIKEIKEALSAHKKANYILLYDHPSRKGFDFMVKGNQIIELAAMVSMLDKELLAVAVSMAEVREPGIMAVVANMVDLFKKESEMLDIMGENDLNLSNEEKDYESIWEAAKGGNGATDTADANPLHPLQVGPAGVPEDRAGDSKDSDGDNA